MADSRARAEEFLKKSTANDLLVPRTPTAAVAGVQPLGPTAAAGPRETRFSVFIPEHQEQALDLAARFMEIANQNPGEAGLEKVLDLAEQEAANTSTALAQYALMVFITQHPAGNRLPIPRLEERDPTAVLPSPPMPPTMAAALGAAGNEAKLDWFREDAAANDHHIHWHIVYPWAGSRDPRNPSRRFEKDRQGELFVYMHQQMLARYDAERLSVGLQPVKPLSNLDAAIPEAYQPNLPQFADRPANTFLKDSLQPSLPNLKKWDQQIFGDAIKKNATFRDSNGGTVAVTAETLGATVEATLASVNQPLYGNLHNMGHVQIAFIPPATQAVPGVMITPEVAIRDPIFFRWHRHIDDLGAAWQDKQGPQTFPPPPPITIRKVLGGGVAEPAASPDIILCNASAFAGDPQAFGDAQFGGAKWDVDPQTSGKTTDELQTTMKSRQIMGVQVDYLDHEDFFYFFRVANDTAAQQMITFRVFIAPTDNDGMDDRRRWIEMDKFQYALAPNAKAVVARSSKDASVVRKPAARPGDPPHAPQPGADPNYCDCGWPYHLLLPRGTNAGMPFRLMVMITNWNDDKVEVEGTCGSMSYCGKKDKDYPDKMPMGFPFHRPWPQNISQTIAATKNMAARDFTIRWV